MSNPFPLLCRAFSSSPSTPYLSSSTHTFLSTSLSPAHLYRLLVSCIVPRPIAWISSLSLPSVSPNGIPIANLAPFSFFSGISSCPPVLSVSITAERDGLDKHTLTNIETTKEFVVNISPASLSSSSLLNQTSAPYPRTVSEFDACGIPFIPSLIVKPPRVDPSISPIAMECVLHGTYQVGKRGGLGTSTVVFGEIKAIHVENGIYGGDYKVDIYKLDPLSRLGGASYGKTREVFDLERPKLPGTGKGKTATDVKQTKA